MTTIPERVATFRLSGDCQTGARTKVSFEDHEVLMDEPPERGGANQGPTPVATLLSALVGCTNRFTHRLADRHGVTIDNLDINMAAKFDRLCMEEDLDLPFPEIDILIDMTTSADDEAIETIKREVPIFCPVAKVFRQAGTQLNYTWTISRP